MPKTLEDEVPNKPTILEVGPAGSGKSTFAYRFPKPYVINADINMAGPRKQLQEEHHDTKGIVYDDVHTDDSGKAVENLQRFTRFSKLLGDAVASPLYETIILDSVTSLVPIFKNEVLRQGAKPEGFKFTFDEWDKFLFLWSRTIQLLRGCGKTVILIGHLVADKGPMDQVWQYVLSVPGQSGNLIPIFVTDVWRFSVDTELVGGGPKPKYVIRTIQDERYPNIKTSLKLPAKFDATQEMVNNIVKQIKGETT